MKPKIKQNENFSIEKILFFLLSDFKKRVKIFFEEKKNIHKLEKKTASHTFSYLTATPKL